MDVRIYVVGCTKAYSMSEQGEGLSLSPWGSNTPYYEGDDDGGTDYELPSGYGVAESQAGSLEIYRPDGSYAGRPYLRGHRVYVDGHRLSEVVGREPILHDIQLDDAD